MDRLMIGCASESFGWNQAHHSHQKLVRCTLFERYPYQHCRWLAWVLRFGGNFVTLFDTILRILFRAFCRVLSSSYWLQLFIWRTPTIDIMKGT